MWSKIFNPLFLIWLSDILILSSVSRAWINFIIVWVAKHQFVWNLSDQKWSTLLRDAANAITGNKKKHPGHVSQSVKLQTGKINKSIIESTHFQRQSYLFIRILKVQYSDDRSPTISRNCLRNYIHKFPHLLVNPRNFPAHRSLSSAITVCFRAIFKANARKWPHRDSI